MAPVPTPLTHLFLLGRFHLTFDSATVTLSLPAQRLLAHLAIVHRDQRANRTALAERLWPDATPVQAVSNLRSVLWRLPRPRGRQLVGTEATSLHLGAHVEVDLWQGEELADDLSAEPRAHHPVLQDLGVVHVLRHDLLPDWHEEWLDIERESYRQKRMHALERYSAHLRERGRYVEALSAGLRAVQAEPLRESAHRRVIEVHLAEGNQAEALREFEAYRQLLAAELGIEPSDGMLELLGPLLERSRRVPSAGRGFRMLTRQVGTEPADGTSRRVPPGL